VSPPVKSCSILAEDDFECICTQRKAKSFVKQTGIKKGSKEATSLQEKPQRWTEILQEVLYKN